jgi:hypothetical protein
MIPKLHAHGVKMTRRVRKTQKKGKKEKKKKKKGAPHGVISLIE